MSTSMLFQTERHGETLVAVPLQTVVSLDEADVRAELDELIVQLSQPGVKNLVVDFGQADHFGSSMLTTMQSVWRRVYAQHGRMGLCNVSAAAREVLKLVKLDGRWPVFTSRDDALAAMKT